MESYEIAEFQKPKEAAKPIGSEIASSREANEVMMAMYAAKNAPRDPLTVYDRIMTDCGRYNLAEKAIYSYPRGGTTVTGPSINLARVLIRHWGNSRSGFTVLDQTATESTVEAYCWDLETNYKASKIFTVPHVRETKKGSYPLTDPRDIYELIANQAARRERACILSVIPQDIVDAAVGKCQDTLKKGGSMPLPDKIRSLVSQFQKQYGVTRQQLEAYTGTKVEAFSEQTVNDLKAVYNAIREGEATASSFFDMAIISPAPAAVAPPPAPRKSLDDL